MFARLRMLALAAVLLAFPARAEDWTTTDGQTYRHVKVMSHDDAYVTILDSDGGARVLQRTLGPELQKRFGYDAAKAAACEAATLAADRKDHAALAAQQAVASAPATPVPPVPPPATPPQPVILHGPAAPPKRPAVDVLANNIQIDRDKKLLEDLEVDIRDAQRDQEREVWHSNYHYDNTGTIHPNTIGDSPQDRISALQKKKKKLEDEISDLKAQNASASQPAQ